MSDTNNKKTRTRKPIEAKAPVRVYTSKSEPRGNKKSKPQHRNEGDKRSSNRLDNDNKRNQRPKSDDRSVHKNYDSSKSRFDKRNADKPFSSDKSNHSSKLNLKRTSNTRNLSDDDHKAPREVRHNNERFNKKGKPYNKENKNEVLKRHERSANPHATKRYTKDVPTNKFGSRNNPKPANTKQVPSKAGNYFTQTFGIDKALSKKEIITKQDEAYFARVAKKLAAIDEEERAFDRKGKQESTRPQEGKMPLNKFLAHSGISGRREAAELIKQGKVKVNNEVITEPGYKVQQTDTIKFDGKIVKIEGRLVYILLNKPKDYITTTEDERGRKTVLDLVQNACSERIFPVGRLDRNTSGLLLLTNDGELAQKLSHPKNNIKKLYQVNLDRALSKEDFKAILQGLTLEDGVIQVDQLAYADANDPSKIGIELHSGKNRIVRRIFEHLGYQVKQLDRVMYANLTKKNLPRGKWRMLTQKEVTYLKHFK